MSSTLSCLKYTVAHLLGMHNGQRYNSVFYHGHQLKVWQAGQGIRRNAIGKLVTTV